MEKKIKDEYIPNEIPLWERVKILFFSGFFVIYGGYGVWVNDLAVRFGGRGHGGKIYHIHDSAALVMYVGFICVSACFISEVIDHYDRRNNEHLYHKFANFTLWPGVVLCVLAVYLNK